MTFYAEIYEKELLDIIKESKIIGKTYILREKDRIIITDDPWMLLDKSIPKEWKGEIAGMLWDKKKEKKKRDSKATFSIREMRIEIEKMVKLRIFYMAQKLESWTIGSGPNKIEADTGTEIGLVLRKLRRIYEAKKVEAWA